MHGLKLGLAARANRRRATVRRPGFTLADLGNGQLLSGLEAVLVEQVIEAGNGVRAGLVALGDATQGVARLDYVDDRAVSGGWQSQDEG